jgi:protein-S-isoprenylcysteine O-methyltransferase Ste14
MTFNADAPAELAFAVVAVCWLGFGLILALGKKRAAKSEAKRDVKSRLGFLLQCIAYAICFGFYRTYFSPLLPISKTAEEMLAALTIAIAVVSEWFCFVAARTLGKQWALTARLIEGHELIMHGPYAVVRNPIYLAMFGMLLATGLAVSRWGALITATIVFLVGNEIRVRSEERLLREAFGPKFADYARRVPAFLPRLRQGRASEGSRR